MLWEVDIYAAEGQPDIVAKEVAAAAAELHLAADLAVTSARGYLIQGELDSHQIARIADELLTDRVVEWHNTAPVGNEALCRFDHEALGQLPKGRAQWIHVLPKPGVMDPVAQSAMQAIADLGLRAEAVRTLKKYAIGGLPAEKLPLLCSKVLANDAIEQVIVGPLSFDRLQVGSPYEFRLVAVPIGAMDDDALVRLSREGQL